MLCRRDFRVFDRLDHRDSAILKGMAIAAIVFHNFFHFVSPAHQNEFTFDPRRFVIFVQTVCHPSLAIQACFSFFGHFGVQIFVFLSAYGLAKSHWDDPSSWGAFMAGRIRKLYPAFCVIVLPWFIVGCFTIHSLQAFVHTGLEIALMLLGVSTLLGFGLPPVGPWWFIPFIVQFYAIWFLLRKLTNRYGWVGLLAVTALCAALTAAVNPSLLHYHINLFMTPVGRMSGLCFGILAARYPIRLNVSLAVVSAAVLVLGSRYAVLWPFTFPAATCLGLWIYMRLRNTLRQSSLLALMGECSLFVFLINGIVRDVIVHYSRGPASQILFALASAGVSFCISALLFCWFSYGARQQRAASAPGAAQPQVPYLVRPSSDPTQEMSA
jgi:peptidoglycan/LPS O-acetylase OafA/YrhL